jgi:hypothetical protein
MRFEIVVTALPGSQIYSLYRFFAGNALLRQQISAIGSVDVIKCLEDNRMAERVPEALLQLGMTAWGRTPETMPISTKKTGRALVAPRGPGRPANAQYSNPHEDLPSRLNAPLVVVGA